MRNESMLNLGLDLAPLSGVRVESYCLDEPFVDLAARFAHLPGTVLLLSGGDLDCSRYHLLGIWPWLTVRYQHRQLHLSVDGAERTLRQNPFEVLDGLVRGLTLPPGDYPPPFAAGLMGYLSYDLKDELEVLPRTSVDDLQLPHMLLHGHALTVVHDRQQRSTRLLLPLRRGRESQAAGVIERFRQRACAPRPESAGYVMDASGLGANFSPAQYETAVQRIIDYIAAGDVYQVNLSQRFQAPFGGSAFALFRKLFELNPAPFFALIQGGDHQILSTSPERFLLQTGRQVETRPIKGTRPRGETPAQDQALAAELMASAKDDAELSMIVDLLRNDLGKVCRPGSVRVAEHKRIEAYQNVYHLISIVTGELEEKQNSVDLIRATFPGGSITGCPKVRAMEIIDELEPCRRHVYCGSIGYISFHDTLDLSIAIRTATVRHDTLCFSVGGGIVFDSSPRAEYEETLHKGRALMAACRQADAPRPEPMAWLNGSVLPVAAARIPVSDQGVLYGYGFFETIRVDRGRAPLLNDHQARFATAWRALMPSPPPDLSWETIISQVVTANGLQHQCAAVKFMATRGSRVQAPWDHAMVVTARPYHHRLAGKAQAGLRLGTYPEPRQTPLAGHKTLNYLYYLLAGQWASRNNFDEALILNPDGTISETNTASLLLINGLEVARPVSAAALPGVMAGALGRVLAQWGYTIVQRPVRSEELLSAGQVLVANALMGAVAVVQIDAVQRPAGGDLWQRLNDAVIPGWRDKEGDRT
jgi:para-aminobenzoate synthetase component 1